MVMENLKKEHWRPTRSTNSVSTTCGVERQRGIATEIPPNPAHVHIYFDQQELAAGSRQILCALPASAGRPPDKGKPLNNWKTAAAKWIWHLKLQRPYLRLK
jgi:hypothetical protein